MSNFPEISLIRFRHAQTESDPMWEDPAGGYSAQQLQNLVRYMLPSAGFMVVTAATHI